MPELNIVLPAMGEGVIEATITKWLVKEGASVKEDDPLVEVATDKVDTEVPSPADGVVSRIIAAEGTVVKVGEPMALLESSIGQKPGNAAKVEREIGRIQQTITAVRQQKKKESETSRDMKSRTPAGKFLSPLVRSIAA